MTAAELIDRLREFPPERPVMVLAEADALSPGSVVMAPAEFVEEAQSLAPYNLGTVVVTIAAE